MNFFIQILKTVLLKVRFCLQYMMYWKIFPKETEKFLFPELWNIKHGNRYRKRKKFHPHAVKRIENEILYKLREKLKQYL